VEYTSDDGGQNSEEHEEEEGHYKGEGHYEDEVVGVMDLLQDLYPHIDT
jgi:hypothetical protein